MVKKMRGKKTQAHHAPCVDEMTSAKVKALGV